MKISEKNMSTVQFYNLCFSFFVFFSTELQYGNNYLIN